MAGKLQRVGIAAETHGIQALLLDPNEIANHTTLPEHGCLSFRRASEELATTSTVVKALVVGGYLKTRVERCARTRIPNEVIDPLELERFRSEFISLDQFANEHKAARRNLRQTLSEIGVEPAFPPEKVRATFYRRADVSGWSKSV
ncbi:hypothetical protein I6F26_11920 [Ensifer sp. IC3342]|nr:hypothetical protein [Ensifer sp. BRP08]MCA1447280.1 hypothetical protein [Ensifer sp. IC3342]